MCRAGYRTDTGFETQRAEYLVQTLEKRLDNLGDLVGLVTARRLVTEARGYLPNYPRAAAHTIAWAVASVRSDDLNPIEVGFALLNGVLALNPSETRSYGRSTS